MADNVQLNNGTGGDIAAADDISGVKYQRIKLVLGNDGQNDGDVSGTNPVPVSGTVNIGTLPAVEITNDSGNPVPVSGTVTVNTGLTDTQLRAAAVPVSGTVNIGTLPAVEITNDSGNPIPVSGTVTVNTGLTDVQLRATAVPVSGTVTANTGLTQPLTDTQLRATPVPVSGTVTVNTGLTDTQLRATPVPVSLSSVEISNDSGNPIPISGTVNTGLTQPLTDTQLRATAVPVSGTVNIGTLPAVEITNDSGNPIPVSGTVTVNTGLTDAQLRATPVPVSIGAVASHDVTNAGTFAVQVTGNTAESPIFTSDGVLVWLKRIFQALKPLGQITGGGSNRLSVDVNSGSIGTVTTVTTTGTVTTLNQMGGITTFELLKAMSRDAYNNGIRSRL